jgi:hypothetical protein
MTAVEVRPPKARTGWAIVAAFIAYAVLYFIYGFLEIGIVLLGRYDHSGAWYYAAWAMGLVHAPLAAFVMLSVVGSLFKHAHLQTVFYSFATGLVVITLMSVALNVERAMSLVPALIEAVLSIIGARMFLAWASIR